MTSGNNILLATVANLEAERDRLQAENEQLRDDAEHARQQRDNARTDCDYLSQRLRIMAREVNERLDWIIRDRTEPDKVLANVSTTRSVLIRELAVATDETRNDGGTDAPRTA